MSMDYSGLNRLAEEQQRALANTEQELQKWNKFKEDYLTLRAKIEVLPNQVTYDYMVPFGPLAMMPGQLIHTNEVMVLLGDNWFAEMSATQSCEVIDRRLADIEKSIKRLNGQKSLLESRRDFTKNEFSSAEVDIKEDYDSDEDKKWRESHKASIEREKSAQRQLLSCHTDGDVLERLEALQLQEMRGRELYKLTEDVEQSTQVTRSSGDPKSANQRKAVHWGASKTDDTSLTLPSDSSDDENDSMSSGTMDSDDSYTSTPAVIHFKHSPRSEEEIEDPTEKHSDDSIKSPSDIYRLYHKTTRSILKQERSFEEAKANIQPEPKPATIERKSTRVIDNQTAAVRSHVVEKSTIAEAGYHCELENEPLAKPSLSPTIQEPSETKQTARVSKFKALRQNRQS